MVRRLIGITPVSDAPFYLATFDAPGTDEGPITLELPHGFGLMLGAFYLFAPAAFPTGDDG